MPLSETTASAERDRLYCLLQEVLDTNPLLVGSVKFDRIPLDLRRRVESGMEDIDASRREHPTNKEAPA